jgi:hypothetical protein
LGLTGEGASPASLVERTLPGLFIGLHVGDGAPMEAAVSPGAEAAAMRLGLVSLAIGLETLGPVREAALVASLDRCEQQAPPGAPSRP